MPMPIPIPIPVAPPLLTTIWILAPPESREFRCECKKVKGSNPSDPATAKGGAAAGVAPMNSERSFVSRRSNECNGSGLVLGLRGGSSSMKPELQRGQMTSSSGEGGGGRGSSRLHRWQ